MWDRLRLCRFTPAEPRGELLKTWDSRRAAASPFTEVALQRNVTADAAGWEQFCWGAERRSSETPHPTAKPGLSTCVEYPTTPRSLGTFSQSRSGGYLRGGRQTWQVRGDPNHCPTEGGPSEGSLGMEGLIWREEGNRRHGRCPGQRQVWGPQSRLESGLPWTWG